MENAGEGKYSREENKQDGHNWSFLKPVAYMHQVTAMHSVFCQLSVPMHRAPGSQVFVKVEHKDHTDKHKCHEKVAQSVLNCNYFVHFIALGICSTPVFLRPVDLDVLHKWHWLDEQENHFNYESFGSVKITDCLLDETFVFLLKHDHLAVLVLASVLVKHLQQTKRQSVVVPVGAHPLPYYSAYASYDQ